MFFPWMDISRPFSSMSFIDSKVGTYSSSNKNSTSIIISKSINVICMFSDPNDFFLPPIPFTALSSAGFMAMKSLKTFQYAVYCLSDIIDVRLAHVSILIP